MSQSNYSLKEKAEALVVLESNDGNKSQTKRDTGISRKTLGKWEKKKDQILSDYKLMQKAEEEGLPEERAEEAVEHAKIGEDYELAKDHLANTFEGIVDKASQIVMQKMQGLDAKDAMWVASTGLDKVMKLKGEPDQIIEVRNVLIHEIVLKLREAVDEGVIDENQASKLSSKFDEIDEAEYEEVS